MASTIRSVVYSAANHSVPNPYVSSGFIWNAVSLAHTIHRSYHFISRLDRYSRLENAPPLLVGIALEIAVGDKKIVNFIAKTLECSLHTLKGVNAYMRLQTSIDKFHQLTSFKDGNFKKLNIVQDLEHPYLSSVSLLSWNHLKNRYQYTAFHLLDTIIDIAANFFLLASHMVAACEAMQGHDLQVIEAPLNLRDIFREAYDLNRGDFIKVNDQILKGLGAKFDTRSLYSYVETKEEGKEAKIEEKKSDIEETLGSLKRMGQHFMSKLVQLGPLKSAIPTPFIMLSPYETTKAATNFHTVIIHKKLK